MDGNLLANIKTKERSVNFTQAEMDRLQTLLAKYKNILFCKQTDGISTKQKESAWSKIEVEFNALADTPRTDKQLKYKFENLKRTAKKGACKVRQEMRRTGGGPPPTPPPGLGDATDWLRKIMPSSIDGNMAIYDDDVINQTPVFPAKKPESITKQPEGIIIEVIDEYATEQSHLPKKPAKSSVDAIEVVEDHEDHRTEKYHLQNKVLFAYKIPIIHINPLPDNDITPADVNEASKVKWDFDPSTPYSSLKKPMSSPLKRRTNKRRTVENFNSNIVRQLLREKKLSVMDNLQELELQKIKEAIRHAQELHEQMLRHNEERHQLEIEKLQLDIKIKRNLQNSSL